MTAQFKDDVIFKGDTYSLLDSSRHLRMRGSFANPEQFGMTAEMMHTACRSGYFCVYEVTSDAMYLRQMTLLERTRNYLPIDGVLPTMHADEYSGASYSGLNVPLLVSGTIRLVREFDATRYYELYELTRMEPLVSGFNVVLDVTLTDGLATGVVDRSSESWEGLDQLDADLPRSAKLREYLDNL